MTARDWALCVALFFNALLLGVLVGQHTAPGLREPALESRALEAPTEQGRDPRLHLRAAIYASISEAEQKDFATHAAAHFTEHERLMRANEQARERLARLVSGQDWTVDELAVAFDSVNDTELEMRAAVDALLLARLKALDAGELDLVRRHLAEFEAEPAPAASPGAALR